VPPTSSGTTSAAPSITTAWTFRGSISTSGPTARARHLRPAAPVRQLRQYLALQAKGIGLDLPKRIERIDEVPEIALAPGCADMPGRRFAEPRGDLSLVEGVRILRTLGTVRELAAGTQPLSFRLLCVPRRGEAALCTADERAALAAMPLHTAYAIERTPRPVSCQPDDHLGGDLVLFDREGPGFWQVRMIAMGQPEATVVFSAAGRRVACL
jgi:hypothetical protein